MGEQGHDITSRRESAPSLEAVATTRPLRPNDGIMYAHTTPLTRAGSDYGTDVDVAALSDYGSDIGFDDIHDTVLGDALHTINSERPVEKTAVLPSIEFAEGEGEDEAEEHVDGFVHVHRPAVLRVARAKRKSGDAVDVQSSPARERTALEVEYDERSRRAWSVPLKDPPAVSPTRASTSARYKSDAGASQAANPPPTPQAVADAENDTRPPLERFRTKPKKPLSVTDLVSPAWCELQYFYTLTKFGRKPRTHAMRTGSKIHQELEDQVHTTVPVQVQSKEDRFGLRMWNAISGLRCLRDTGLTRELEVWGVIEGQVVNGVIDELSYECPDADFQAQLEKTRAEREGGVVPLPPGQPSITAAFAKSSSPKDDSAWVGSLEPDRQIYLADVKTRSVESLPTGASLRPTWMQLMLYRKLLESLSLNTVDAETIFARYDIQPLANFTDTFLSEIGGIGPSNEASSFPNLLSLWSLLVTEMQETLPPTSLSPLLRAEFRYAKTGDIIGSELTVYDPAIIDHYIAQEMAFWKGTRQPKGVEVEEAFKCRICDFSEDCSWRKTKVEEATEKSRLRRLARERSAV